MIVSYLIDYIDKRRDTVVRTSVLREYLYIQRVTT